MPFFSLICFFLLLSSSSSLLLLFFRFSFSLFYKEATSNKSYVKIFEKEDNTKRYEIDTMSQV